jgi:hypothetical protein
MRPMNCRLGDLAMVVRNTSGCPCTGHEIGRPVECKHLALYPFGPVWMLPAPIACKTCGGKVLGFLDADLQPIRPRRRDDDRGTITELVVDVREGVAA